jgi:hypothetical protein
LIPAASPPIADTENYPHLAIGGGIGGVALAVAVCTAVFTLYERDSSFERLDLRATDLQQAGKAIEGFSQNGVVSTRHLVHTTDGNVIERMGNEKWMQSDAKRAPKRTNIHIARQSLRLTTGATRWT